MDNEEGADKTCSVSTKKYFNEEEFVQLCRVENGSFPKKMREGPAALREIIDNQKGIRVVLKNGKGRIVGYILSIPHNDAYKYLKEHDPYFKEDSSALYIEWAAILPRYRHRGEFFKLFRRFITEARRRGYRKITMHSRSNVFTPIMQHYGAHKLYAIQNWYGFQEPFDYMEYQI